MRLSPIPRTLYPVPRFHKRLFTIPHTLYAIPLFFCLPALADGTININNPSAGTGWTFADSVVTITANGNYTVTGTTTANRIVINKDVTATITLNNANIHSAVASPFMLSSDSVSGSDVTLILSGSNELVTTNIGSAGLTVEDSAKIIIEGAGSLLAQGEGVNPRGGAGIGGGTVKTAGTVIIKSGTITAIGGISAAGIGGGPYGSGGKITITGGTITATGGEWAAGIGGGGAGSGGSIIVTGGSITATGGSSAAGIGGGFERDGGNITIASGTITATGGTQGAGIGGGYYGYGGNITIENGTITATGGSASAGIGGGRNGSGGNITVTGGTITVTGEQYGAGIGGGYRGAGGNITVTGGTITATGGYSGAGIGGGLEGSGGNNTIITITGGMITATGGETGAGIGGGGREDGGKITITGGTVAATGGTEAAGIGGGRESNTGGNITVIGGMVTATSKGSGAGIGGGYWGAGGSITITGGVVVAVAVISNGDPAGIGGGAEGDAGTVNITGGTVYASGGTGPGIGGGAGATGGGINITGGAVIADEIGLGNGNGTTQTNISGANTIALSPAINANSFGQAKVLTGDSVNVSDAISGDTIVKVTLNAALTIPSGATLIVPTGIVFDVNNKALTNNGIIREYGSLLNKGSLTGNQALGAIQAGWITIPNQTYTYTGDSIKPPVTVTNGTLTLAHGVHYTVAYTNNINAGTATATVTDLGDYSIVTKTFTINPKALAAGFIQDIAAQAYTGDSIKPAVTVRDGSKTLTLNTDYTVAYTNNVNAGTATVTITGMGNYTGTATKTFLILNVPGRTIDLRNPVGGTGWTFSDHVFRITDNGDYIVRGTSTADRIVINADVTATVTLENAHIHSAVASPFILSSDTIAGGKGSQVTLILIGSNELVATVEGAGLTAEDSARLTIEGDGSLLAQGAGAGIGGGDMKSGGNITITGGTITAIGGIIAAGVGGGGNAGGGNITITGGTVTATGGYQAAGIGGGVHGEGGKIYVTGGAVTATGGFEAAGIGGGWSGAGGNITIGGGAVHATGGGEGAGIGGGVWGDGGNITISGGAVVAVSLGGNGDAAGIGGGAWGNAGTVNITGGTAYASGGSGAGIGGGAGAAGGVINITGGAVIADEIGMGTYGSTTATNISGANTIALSPSINTESFGGAQVLTGTDIGISCNVLEGKIDYKVTLNAALTIPANETFVVPAGFVLDVNHNVLTNNGTIINYGSIINAELLNGSSPNAIKDSWIENIPDQTWTGYPVTPDLIVRDPYRTLIPGTDYSVEYVNNTALGVGVVTVTGQGIYTRRASKSFLIKRSQQIVLEWLDNIPAQTWTGAPIEPAVTVKDGDRILTLGTDYTVSYSDNTDRGTATVTVTGIGDYTGQVAVPFIIGQGAITEDWLDSIPPQLWTGDSVKPAATVKDGNYTLIPDTDYTVVYSNNVNAGTAVLTVIGKGRFTLNASKTFIIVKQIAGGWLDTIPAQPYGGGEAVKPPVVIKDAGKALALNTDYTVVYSNNVNIGIAVATITGTGYYTGTVSLSFAIVQGVITANWIENIPSQPYTGYPVEPAVIVKNGNVTLARNIDYTVDYTNNVQKGTATATVTGRGYYTGTASKNFTISTDLRAVADNWIQDIPAQTWTGDSIKPAVVVQDGNTTLTLNADYAVAYSNNVHAGTAQVTITGNGDYTGTASKTFAIRRTLTNNMIGGGNDQHYTGGAIEPIAVIDYEKNVVLTRGTDYEIAYSNNTAVGTASFTITGKGYYSGMVGGTFNIVYDHIIIQADWVQEIADRYYTGSAIEPPVTVTGLVANTDYTVEYAGNLNAGTATATVTGCGYYTGTVRKYFTIKPKPIADDWIQDLPSQAWTGYPVEPAITVKDGARTLALNTDYTVAGYSNNVNEGTARVTIAGNGNYAGTAGKPFIIQKRIVSNISSAMISVNDADYTGLPVEPAVTVTDGSRTLSPGTDYTVGYSDNINAGPATVTVTGWGSYAGSVASRTFTIKPKPLAAGWFEDIPDQTYTGSQVRPALAINDGNRALTLNLDYSAAYSNNINTGTATVTVTGAGNYTGSFSKDFTIIPKPLAGDWIEALPAQTYTGLPVEPALTITDGNRTLIRDKDYTVAYFNNLSAGAAYAVIAGKGGYTGEITIPFNIIYGSNPNGIAVMDQTAGRLQAVATDEGLLVSGLTPGESFRIYTLQGQPVYQAQATLSEERIYLRNKGVYIVVAGEKRIKAVY